MMQRVAQGNSVSLWVKVKSGIHQVCVLAPILFVTFINDLPVPLSNVCKLYTDDLKIIADFGRHIKASVIPRFYS